MTKRDIRTKRHITKQFRRFDRVQSREAAEKTKGNKMTGSIHVGLAALGAALGVGLIGMKASEAVGRNPGAATKILVQAILSTAFAEGIVFFAIFLVR
jgi:F-type H+-transporting ATPase subunit c